MRVLSIAIAISLIDSIFPSLVSAALDAEVQHVSHSFGCKAISPPPQGVVCGAHGYLQNPRPEKHYQVIANNQTVASVGKCRQFCLNRRNDPNTHHGHAPCLAFAYSSSSNLCVLYDRPLSRLQFTQSSNDPFMFYSAECFRCPEICPRQPYFNVIDNGGFELSQKYYGPWFFNHLRGVDTHTSVVSPGRNSPNALHCGTPCELNQYVTLCKGQFYHLTFDIKFVKPENYHHRLLLLLGIGDVEYGTFVTKTSDWHKIGATFMAGGEVRKLAIDLTTLEAYSLESPGYLLIDNVEMYPVTGKTTVTGQNKVVNGGFESGKLFPWKISQTSGYNGVPHRYSISTPALTQGKYKFEYHQKTHDTYGYRIGDVSLSQTVDLVRGKHYELSFDFKGDPKVKPPPNNSFEDSYHPDYYVNAGNYVWYREFPSESPDNAIEHFSRVFIAEEEKTLITIDFESDSPYILRQNTYLDNIKLREVTSGGRIGSGNDSS